MTSLSLKTIKFTGFLAKKYGKGATLAGANMFQIMSGLINQFGPQFKEDIRTNDWHLIKGKRKDKKDIGEDELNDSFDENTLHLVPVVKGASAILRVVIGVILVVVGIYFNIPWLTAMGASMIAGGVAQMLTKAPKQQPTQSTSDQGSYIYNGVVNVTSQGGPVPLAYGRLRVSSVIISTDTSSDNILS